MRHKYVSAAQEMLARAHRAGLLPQAATAKECGITQQLLSELIRGASRGSPATRAKLAKPPLEIDVRFWDLPPSVLDPDPDETPRPTTPPNTPAPTSPVSPAFDPLALNMPEPVQPVDLTAPGAALVELQALANRQRAAAIAAAEIGSGVEPTQRVRLESDLRRTLETLAKITHELGPADESKLSQTATFLRFCNKVLDALADYPDARDAVAAVFAGDDDGEPG